MGTYKVPQNVESEDKILGPLSLKQFIYAMIGVGYALLTFAVFQKLIIVWIIVGLPPALALLALGLYQKEDQPLETYILAVAQFITRPKQRLWHKEPIAEVFRVEPPPPAPKLQRRDPRQVRSQLSQLADLVDTRGWSAKQPALQEPQESQETPVIDLRDRIGAEVLSQEAPALGQAMGPGTPEMSGPEVTQADDILSNETPSAQNLNVLIENTVKSVRAEALEKMRQQPTVAATPQPGATVQPAPTAVTPQPATAAASTTAIPAAPSDAILKLATEGGDLTVAQIAAQAHRQQIITEGQTVSLRNANTSTV
jgi:hypothetical protein